MENIFTLKWSVFKMCFLCQVILTIETGNSIPGKKCVSKYRDQESECPEEKGSSNRFV